MPAKLKAEDYHKAALERGLEWIGESLPARTSKVTLWKCREGHIWEAKYANIKHNQRGCPECYKLSRVSRKPEHYHRLAESKGFKWLGPEVKRIKDKTIWECSNRHTWPTSFSHIKQGTGCPHCAGVVPKTEEDYRAVAEEYGLQWLGPMPSNIGQKTLWRCRNGHEFPSPYHTVSRGFGCRRCAGSFPKSPEDYHKLAEEKGFKWLGSQVKNTNTKTQWVCPKGHLANAAYGEIYSGKGCYECVKIPAEDYHGLAQKKGLRWMGEKVINVKTKTTWVCIYKRHHWEATYTRVKASNGCPSCFHLSTYEKRVETFLRQLGIHYERQKKFEACKDKRPLRFDFYLIINNIRLLIEVDGQQHFHPVSVFGDEEEFKNTKRRDEIKNQFVKDYDLILIRIPYTIEGIEAYLQAELEKYLGYSLDSLRQDNLPEVVYNRVTFNPYGWQQLGLPL